MLIYPTVGYVDTGATRCAIPKSVNDTALKLPIKGTDECVIIGKGTVKYDFVIIPILSIVGINERKFVSIDRKNVEAWLGEKFIVGMNVLRTLNITMKNDVITIETD